MNNFSHNAPYRPAIIMVCGITMNATGASCCKTGRLGRWGVGDVSGRFRCCRGRKLILGEGDNFPLRAHY